jgi:phosphoheptose isomerase
VDDIRNWFIENIELAGDLSRDEGLHESISVASELIINAFSAGNKLLVFGNGGSAAEAQHFSAELVCKFEKNRRAFPVIALTTDTSILTAYSNDISFNYAFSRQIEAFCKPGDVVLGITTSDFKENHSRNIFEGFRAAQQKKAIRVGLFSHKTRDLLNFVDVAIQVPGKDTRLIQEAQLSVIHLLCRLIENKA